MKNEVSATSVVPCELVSTGATPMPPWSRRETRRCSDPWRAQQLWDAIGAVRAQKQIPAITRMARFMNRHYQVNKEETQRLLDAAVEDNLIKLELKVGTKGNKSGVQEKAYRLPTMDMLPRERHDWYCFHCHVGGEVLLCAACHRVFHESCIVAEKVVAFPMKVKGAGEEEEDEEDLLDGQEWICVTCVNTQKIQESFNKKERKDLNHLLKLLCHKLKNKIPGSILSREIPQPVNKGLLDGSTSMLENSKSSEGDGSASPQTAEKIAAKAETEKQREEIWRATFLLKQQMTLEEIERKCNSNQYRILEEFRADTQLIVHNIVIFHGVHSSLADSARQMLRDCCSDLRELEICRDCYRYANENREKYWFCKPCRPFHELVYARQKGFPYWPAKVMRVRPDVYEVRFFGGYHQRALVEKNNIRPISVNIHTLQVKRTSLWNKACEELRKHQELLEKCGQNESFNVNEPYGDPFRGMDIKRQLGGGSGQGSNSADKDDDAATDSGEEEQEEIETEEMESRSEKARKLESPKLPVASKSSPVPPVETKKKRGKKKLKKDESENFVSSSSQEARFVTVSVQTPNKFLKKANENSTQARGTSAEELRQIIEKMRADFDQEKKRAVNVATRSLERDLERLKADHATEIEELVEAQKQAITDNKKKQWCFHCETEAIYWCCWNTAYCSIDCQQQHWHKEHKKNCRRKR